MSKNISPNWSRGDPRWQQHAQSDGVLRMMLKTPGMPLDRQTYIDIAHAFDGAPQQWNAEHEASLPQPFRLEPGARGE